MEENHNYIKKLKINRAILQNRYLSYLVIPAILFTTGGTIGKIASSSITEYQTITHTVDAKRGNITSETITYDEKTTEHVATVLQCSPWKKYGEHDYRRNIIAYEYDLKTLLEKDYCLNSTDLETSLRKKYQYIEMQESLTSNENKEETTILIQETFQNKENTRKSTKYVIPGMITGTVLALILDFIIHYQGLLDTNEINWHINKIEKELQKEEAKKSYRK